MSARMELHVALSLRLDAIEAHRLANAYRAEVLREAADALVAACPDGDAEEAFMDCQCVAADELRRMADARQAETGAALSGEPTQPAMCNCGHTALAHRTDGCVADVVRNGLPALCGCPAEVTEL